MAPVHKANNNKYTTRTLCVMHEFNAQCKKHCTSTIKPKGNVFYAHRKTK